MPVARPRPRSSPFVRRARAAWRPPPGGPRNGRTGGDVAGGARPTQRSPPRRRRPCPRAHTWEVMISGDAHSGRLTCAGPRPCAMSPHGPAWPRRHPALPGSGTTPACTNEVPQLLSEVGGVMSQSPDPYAVLGVTSSATPAQISHAFRTKLRALHPDIGPARSRPPDDADAQLQQLLRAYAALRHAGRRSADADQPTARPVDADARGPVTIRITDRRTASPRPRNDLWAGPVRRHR